MSKKREYVSQLSKKQTRYETHAHPHQRTWNDNFPEFKQRQHLQKWACFEFCLRWHSRRCGLISKHDTSWMAEWYGEEINVTIWPLQSSLKVQATCQWSAGAGQAFEKHCYALQKLLGVRRLRNTVTATQRCYDAVMKLASTLFHSAVQRSCSEQEHACDTKDRL